MARRRGGGRGCLGTGALVFGLIVLGITSIVLTVVGATQTVEWFEAQDSLESTTAEVIDVSEWHQPPSPRGRPGVTTYSATVRFETLEGAVIETRIDGTDAIEVGDVIDILYDRDHPTTAMRADLPLPWFGPVSALVIGPLLGVGVGALSVSMVRGALARRR